MRICFLILCGVLFHSPLHAHQQSLSYSHWQLDHGQKIQADFRYSAFEVHANALDETNALVGKLAELFSVSGNGQVCVLHSQQTQNSEAAWYKARIIWQCPSSEALNIRYTGLAENRSAQAHMASLMAADGRQHSAVFNSARHEWQMDFNQSPYAHGYDYLRLGIVHILMGWDHLAFLLALILFATRRKPLLYLITGFTLAHSLTLGAYVLGWISADPVLVEWLIAFSILLLCAENIWLREKQASPWIDAFTLSCLIAAVLLGVFGATFAVGIAVFVLAYFQLLRQQDSAQQAHSRCVYSFAFGLFHGLGFASVLQGLSFQPEQKWMALFSFNIGVEIGQLAFVLLCWPLLGYLRQKQPLSLLCINAVLAALAMYWLASRTL